MAVPSRMVPLGEKAPRFRLETVDGDDVALDDLVGAPAIVVAFLSNHCPYVRHIERRFAEVAREYAGRGVAVVAICSNDVERYPDDDVPGLREQIARAGFDFPYLVDGDQTVAKEYGAACTPDLFVLDSEGRLAYRGEFDAARPKNDEPVTGASLRAALDALLAGRPVSDEQRPSLGCSIKWRPGNEPSWAA